MKSLSVITGGGEPPILEPDWSRSFLDSWQDEGAQLARDAWASLKRRRVLTLHNADQAEIYCVNFARWKLAEAAAARQPLVKGKSGPMVNPMLTVANQAAAICLKIGQTFRPIATQSQPAGAGDLRSRIAALTSGKR